MTAQQHYDTLDSKDRSELLMKIGKTPEEAKVLGQRDYVALGAWIKARLKRYWRRKRFLTQGGS